MFSVIALYTNEVDDAFRARYDQHARLCKAVPGLAQMRYGPVKGSPTGQAPWSWMAELQYTDRDAFRAAASGPEMAATVADVREFSPDVQIFFAALDA